MEGVEGQSRYRGGHISGWVGGEGEVRVDAVGGHTPGYYVDMHRYPLYC